MGFCIYLITARGKERMRKLSIFILSLMVVVMGYAPAIGWAEQASSPSPDIAKQFESLKQQGILEGYADGSAGLERRMTRAEFSAVLVRLLKLNRETGNPSYEDTSSHWAHEQGYIEAVTASRLMEGTQTHVFDPDGNVTLEQLAATLVRGLGLKPAPELAMKGQVSDWAKGYVATAVQLKLLGEQSDYTQAATRETLTVSLSAVEDKLKQAPAVPVGPVSITEVKATGVKKLTVTLNQPVDTGNITFEVKQANALVEGKASFQENRQSADIVFDTVLKEGSYSVELKGLEGTSVGTTRAEATVQKEKMEKIEFVTASDTLPQANNVYVEFKAFNQYGEASTWNANQFVIETGNVKSTAVSGKQAIKLQLQEEDKKSRVSVTILHTETGLIANKTFAIGDRPYVSKIEIGDLLLPGTSKKLIAGAEAYLKLKAFDQYGIPVIAIDGLGQDGASYGLNTYNGIKAVVKDSTVLKIPDGAWYDYDGDEFPELKVIGGTDIDQFRESEITLYALGSGQAMTKKISISLIKGAFSVQFGEFNKVAAVGDKDIILPLIVKDDQGQVLTSNELAAGIDQLTVQSTFGSAASVKLEALGKTRGLLALTGLSVGSGTVTVQIIGTDKKASLSLSIQKERYPAQIMVKTALAPFYIQEAEEGLVILIKDQYGEFIRNASNEYISVLADAADATKVRTDAAYKIHVAYENIGDVSENKALYPTTGPLKPAIDALNASKPLSPNVKEQYRIDETFMQAASGNVEGFNIGNIYNIKLSFKADARKTGSYRLSLTLVKVEHINGTVTVEKLNQLTNTIGVIDGKDPSITYQVVLDTAVDNTLFAAGDAYREGIIVDSTVTGDAYGLVKDRVKLAKEVLLSAKKSGQEVKVPVVWMHNPLGNVASSNTTVANAVYINTGTAAAPLYKYFVIGDKEGSATITALYKTGNSVNATRIEMKTSKKPIEIVRTASSKAYASIEYNKISGKKMWDYPLMGEVILTDQYGSPYKNDVMSAHVKALGLMFYVTDIAYKTAGGDDAVTVDPSTGVVTYTGDGDMASFTLVIAAPSGKKVQTVVNLR